MKIKTYRPHEKWPDSVVLPTQTHGNNIVEIITGQEHLSDCDGIWTCISTMGEKKRRTFQLGIKTADCAPICFWEEERYGILHAGWRGLCNGIIEKMLSKFEKPNVWVGPILPQFEIQKDFCYDQIYTKFGDRFFTSSRNSPFPQRRGDKRILFDFKSALALILPMAKFDNRSTYEKKDLASWRRDQDKRRNLTIISA